MRPSVSAFSFIGAAAISAARASLRWPARGPSFDFVHKCLHPPIGGEAPRLDVQQQPQILGAGVVIRELDAVAVMQKPADVSEADAMDGAPPDTVAHAAACFAFA